MKRILFFISLIILSSSVRADKRPFTSDGGIKFYVDYAGFNGNNGRTFNEFYISVFTDQLEHLNTDSGLIAQIKLSVNIKDNFGDLYYTNSWLTDIILPVENELSKDLISYDQWAVILSPGEYSIWIRMEDLNGEKFGELNKKIIVRNYSNSQFEISDVEFVSSFKKQGQLQFKKGNLFLKPNPWRRYGVLNPVLYAYFELYNLHVQDYDSIQIVYSIIGDDGKRFRNVTTTKKIDNTNSTIFHGIDVSNIPTGIYSLKVEIQDTLKSNSVKTYQEFEIIQPDYLEMSENSNQIITILDKISSYIMTPEQFNSYNTLEQKQKYRFLENFWKSKGQNGENENNEYLMKTIARYKYAERNFSWGNIEGWNSDRGRIVIVYGIPDELDKNVFEQETLPYEIWKYHQDREFEFVFCDLRSDGRYTLIHSTKEGEIYNPKWFSDIKK